MPVKRGNKLLFTDIIARSHVMSVKSSPEKFAKIAYISIWIKRKMFAQSVFSIEIDKMSKVNLSFYKPSLCKVGHFLKRTWFALYIPCTEP